MNRLQVEGHLGPEGTGPGFCKGDGLGRRGVEWRAGLGLRVQGLGFRGC